MARERKRERRENTSCTTPCSNVLNCVHLLSLLLMSASNIWLPSCVPVVHAASAMIAPFQWQHVCIPLLPSSLLSYAAAPVPYLIGVQRYLLARLVCSLTRSLAVAYTLSDELTPDTAHT